MRHVSSNKTSPIHLRGISSLPLLQEDDDTLFAIQVPITEGFTATYPQYNANLVVQSDQEDNAQAQISKVLSKNGVPMKKLLKPERLSRHGIPYPPLSVRAVRKLASPFIRSAKGSAAKLNKETLASIMQASDWFFEQIGEDIGTYANHAGRKTVDDTDVIILMKRFFLILPY